MILFNDFYRMVVKIVIVALCLITLIAKGQKNIFNNWHFGDHGAITFNTNPVSPVVGSALSSQESCASISDSNGVLRFYTDGVKVYN